MMGWTASLLTPAGCRQWADWQSQAKQGGAHRSLRGATLFLALINLFFKLEGPAWRSVRQNYGACFVSPHDGASWRPADPLRFLIQAVFLLVMADPGPEAQSGVTQRPTFMRRTGRRLTEWFDGVTGQLADSRVSRRSWGRIRRLGRTARYSLFAVMVGVAVILALLLVTQPFDYFSQLLFVSLLFGMALLVRRIPGRFSLLMLMILSITISGRYIWWRYSATLNWTSPLDVGFGIGLLLAETYSWIVLLLGYLQVAWPLHRVPVSLPPDRDAWPIVDLMIPTYNEDLSVVKPTVYAVLGMDWPADRLRVHLLDDGGRESFRAFAEEVGIHYIARTRHNHAKAGNLNHAMEITDGELIAIFDCDHIPTRSFLQLTVGHFLKDEKLALVQSPHHFFSPDPFERNLGNFGSSPNENTLFYGLVQDGNDLWNAAFFCGSCAVLRRSALQSIGGFAVQTVTEDAHTALKLHRQGWNSAYTRIPQAAGLATESLSSHIGQRIRWARGMVQIFRLDNPLLGKGLTLVQRLCYANAMLHFLAGIPRLVYLTAPLAFLWLHSYIVYAPAIAILLNVVPHLLHANLTSSALQGSHRRTLWGEIYETVLAWYIARPTLVALLAPKKGAFNVTAKGGLIPIDYYDWTISLPYVVLALANFVGLGFGVWRIINGPGDEIFTVVITMIWVLFNLLILGGALAVAAEVRQIRLSHRVPVDLPMRLQLANGHTLMATLSDYSEEGVGVSLLSEHPIPPDCAVQVCLSRGSREFAFPGRIVRHLGRYVGVRLDALDRQQHIDLVQCTFARADAWLAWQGRIQKDRPVESLQGVIKLGLHGYAQVARYLPFPLNLILRWGAGLASWMLSFVPRMPPVQQPH